MNHVHDIEKLEATLWEAADNLRANSHKSFYTGQSFNEVPVMRSTHWPDR
jgi:hypothetical protein